MCCCRTQQRPSLVPHRGHPSVALFWANGLALMKDGELLLAEGDGKRISKRGKDGTITTLTEGAPGVPLLAPNDLIVDAKGGIYFTDPGPRPDVPGRATHVFYLPAGSKAPIVIGARNPRPNGLVLTSDGKTLIVDDTLGSSFGRLISNPMALPRTSGYSPPCAASRRTMKAA
jgi:gluconolactonase